MKSESITAIAIAAFSVVGLIIILWLCYLIRSRTTRHITNLQTIENPIMI
jgi:hypothetical protein